MNENMPTKRSEREAVAILKEALGPFADELDTGPYGVRLACESGSGVSVGRLIVLMARALDKARAEPQIIKVPMDLRDRICEWATRSDMNIRIVDAMIVAALVALIVGVWKLGHA